MVSPLYVLFSASNSLNSLWHCSQGKGFLRVCAPQCFKLTKFVGALFTWAFICVFCLNSEFLCLITSNTWDIDINKSIEVHKWKPFKRTALPVSFTDWLMRHGNEDKNSKNLILMNPHFLVILVRFTQPFEKKCALNWGCTKSGFYYIKNW